MDEVDAACCHCKREFAYAFCYHSRNPVAYCPHCGCPQVVKQVGGTRKGQGIFPALPGDR